MHLKTLETIVQVSCGADHTLARGLSGVWAWGNGSGGKLGMGDHTDRFEPCLVNGMKGKSVLQVAAGTWHSMAIVCYAPMIGAGWLYTWGSGYHGQLAQGPRTVAYAPQIVEFLLGVNITLKSVSTGSHHCMAVTKEGELYSWGSNANGCLGRFVFFLKSHFSPAMLFNLVHPADDLLTDALTRKTLCTLPHPVTSLALERW